MRLYIVSIAALVLSAHAFGSDMDCPKFAHAYDHCVQNTNGNLEQSSIAGYEFTLHQDPSTGATQSIDMTELDYPSGSGSAVLYPDGKDHPEPGVDDLYSNTSCTNQSLLVDSKAIETDPPLTLEMKFLFTVRGQTLTYQDPGQPGSIVTCTAKSGN